MTIYEMAQKYISWGWVIHPLHPPTADVKSPGKQPILKEWSRKTKTTIEEIQTWFGNGSSYNIGLVCGSASGVDVLDFDKKLYINLLFPDDFETMISRRTKDRCHIYIKHIPMTAFKNHELGVELLGDGKEGSSNAVMPPSLHPEGQIYTFNRMDGKIITLTDRQRLVLSSIAKYKENKNSLRPCFRSMIDTIIEWHGGDGRQRMLALATELKANKGTEIDALVFANRVYGGDFSVKDTVAEWKNVDPTKPWKCETIRSNFPDVLNLCQSCTHKFEGAQASTKYDSMVAELMKERSFITIAETEEMMSYHEGIFHPLGDVVIKTQCQLKDDKITTHNVNEVISTIKRKTYVHIKELNKNVHYIPIENGVFNIKSNELENHDPAFLLTIKIPIKYNQDAKCPNIDKFFSDILAPDDVEAIKEFFGYCLLRNYPIQKAFMLNGGGANGKSTLLNLLKGFLGGEAICSVSLQEIEENHFAAANLFGKLANIYADLPPDTLQTTGKIKMLTGGDTITAEKKFGGFFSFVNYAKMIFSTNRIPISKDETDAYFRRWVIINFPNTFDGANCDTHLIDKLTTPEELSGLFNYAVEGLQRLLTNNRFSNQKSTDYIKDLYIRLSDSVQAFVLDWIEPSPTGRIPKKALIQIYGNYCKTHNIPAVSEKKFFTSFCQLVRVEEVRSAGEGRQREFIGVMFKMNLGKSVTDYVCNTENKEEIVQDVHYVQDSLLLSKSIESNIINNSNTIGENISHHGRGGQDKTVTELVDKKGIEFQHLKSQLITSQNIVEFSMWFCEQTGHKSPDEIKGLASKLFKLTPETTQKQKEPHLSYLCKNAQCKDCAGFECDCECHRGKL